MVIDTLEPEIGKGGCIIDFHTSGFFPERWYKLVFLLRASNTILYDRLKAKGYLPKKIEENVECELLEVTSEEVYSSYKENIICQLKNELPEDLQTNIQIIIDKIQELNKK